VRVVLSWLVGLFRCPGCVALQSERDYLRSILASTRSMTRDVSTVSVPTAQVGPFNVLPGVLTTTNDPPEQPANRLHRWPVMDRDVSDLPEMPA
jgi:hypothetical protein